LRDGGPSLRLRRVNLRALRHHLAVLRFDLPVLRGNLFLEHAIVALGLIELLGGGRLLRKQPRGALVRPPRDLELRL
jgi:hypothetical protein